MVTGNTFGRQVLDQVGYSVRVSADANPKMKPGGITLDWTTVGTVGADTYLQDGVFIPNGEAYLRYGQVVTRITGAAQIQTITVTGTPTSGTFTLAGTRPDNGAGFTVVVPYNASAAAAQTLFDAAVGVGNTTVGGGALPGTALTATWNGLFGNSPALMTLAANALAGGTTPTATVATTQAGNVSGGLWGPYDPAASDGRATLTKGDTFVLDSTVRSVDVHSNHPPVIQGGLVWQARLIATTGTHSLAAGPTFTELEAAVPTLLYAKF